MQNFSNIQKANCVIWLAETNDIPTVQERFREEFCKNHPDAKIPTDDEIHHWYENFKKTGVYEHDSKNLVTVSSITQEIKHVSFVPQRTVHKEPSGIDLHATDYEKETGLLNFFGFRKIHKCQEYRMHLKGKLREEDKVERTIFAQTELERIHSVHHMIHRIWFCGEATFYTNGRVACHNLVYLAEDLDDPESKTPPPNTASCVTVWAALNFEGLLGPYITSGNAKSNSYNLFLRKFAYELKQIQRLKIKLEDPIFIHDDSPLHKDEQAQDFLSREFPFYWIGPGSKHAEFPRLSPDLNPLAFFLWGHIKHRVYETPIENDDTTELGHRIHIAFTEIMPEMLGAAIKAYKERLKLIVDSKGELVDVHDDNENQISYMDGNVIPYYLY